MDLWSSLAAAVILAAGAAFSYSKKRYDFAIWLMLAVAVALAVVAASLLVSAGG